MRIFALKKKHPQQTTSFNSAKLGRARSRQIRNVHANQTLQHIVGNQATQRLMAADHGSDARSAVAASMGVKRGLRQLTTHVSAERRMRPTSSVGSPGDAFEQEADRVADQVVRMKHLERRTSDGTHNPSAPRRRRASTQLGNSAGRPIESGTRAEISRRFGADFGDVRVHTDASAMHLNQDLNARAFTSGSHIFFNKDEYNPRSTDGRKLLAHELTHVLQQRGQTAHSSGKAAPSVQRKPDYLVTTNFIGTSVEVNPTMRDRLQDVEADLQAQYDALGPDSAERTHPGGDPMSFREWAGIRTARAWRSGSSTSKHASGSAIDVNYALQPYIATRTIRPKADGTMETIYGGEAAGASLQDERRRATEVYDRAMEFTTEGTAADVGARESGESTASVYNRFYSVDYALRRYFGTVFHTTPMRVDRAPIADIEGASEAELLAAIPTTERKEEADAIQTLEGYMHTGFSISRASWPLTPRQQFFRILRDYEHVRIPMVMGNPAARPARTRNPARGFLAMSRKFVVAMVDVGRLRWGIADFGAHSSGDVHHFDLGNHGGYTPDGTP